MKTTEFKTVLVSANNVETISRCADVEKITDFSRVWWIEKYLTDKRMFAKKELSDKISYLQKRIVKKQNSKLESDLQKLKNIEESKEISAIYINIEWKR